MRYQCLWLTYIILSGSAVSVPNQQVDFSNSADANQVHYQYRWYDHNNQLREIQFDIEKNRLSGLPNTQTNYSATLITQKVKQDWLRLAKRIDPKRARVNIQQVGQELKVNIKSSDPALVDLLNSEFSNQQALTLKQYFRQHYFQYFTLANGNSGVKADHVRYIQEFSEVLRPAAERFYESLGEQASIRDYINLVLSWAQSIPYNPLIDRSESNGSGFSPPIALLNNNRGDCDSKSVLVAALIRNFLPQSQFRLVILPNHALLAINLNKAKNDVTLQDKGIELIVMEPTGPAPLKLGELGQASQHFVARGLVTLQTIP